MTTWLRDGLEGRSLKATLRIYLIGLMILAPVAVLTGFLSDIDTLFLLTPLLVALLVALQYGVSYQAKVRGFVTGVFKKKDFQQVSEPFINESSDISPMLREGSVQEAQEAQVLGQIGGSLSVESLIHALSDEDAEVRWRATFALGRIGEPQAVEPLIRALDDEYAKVREHAALALAPIDDNRSIKPLLIAAVNDKDPRVRLAARAALKKKGFLGDPQAIEYLTGSSQDEDEAARTKKRA